MAVPETAVSGEAFWGGPLVCPSMSRRRISGVPGRRFRSISGPRASRLALIATLAGAFSALFGVGGGVVIVPLLLLWLGYGEHEATGTSLAAIAVIAALAATVHAAYGNVDFLDGLLIGLPAVAGVVIGTALQQRLSGRAVSLMFATLLVAVSLILLIP
jgi:uncharacterized membrane protein YfcA